MSFNIALSGIQAINEQLTTLSNNIANAGTYGFKSSRANFASVYAGDQANGVQVQSLTQNISQTGSLSSTGRGMDAAIQGRGFFTSRDTQGVVSYSRVGIFSTNADGLLVDSTGKKVQGYGPTVGGVLGTMGDIAIPTGQIPAVATTKVSYAGNMSGDWKTPTAAFNATDANTYNMVKQSVVYDSLGTQHTVSQYFVKTDADTVTVHYSLDGAAPATNFALNFGTNGQILPASTTGPVLNIPGAATGAANMAFNFDYTGTSKFAGEATNTTNRADGYASGTFVGVELAENGSIVAKYSNEQQLGKHVLVGADRARGRGDGIAVRVAVRVAIQAEGIRGGGDHDQLSPMRISDCCIDLMRPITSTLVSKAREAAIMSAISATSLTFA
jgi:flagellar hook protein FlgE